MKPFVNIMSNEMTENIIDQAVNLLETTGCLVENVEARDLLLSCGADAGGSSGRIRIKREMIESTLESASSSVTLYDRSGENPIVLGGDEVHFDPGSAALNILDGENGEVRRALTGDYIDLCRIVETLQHIEVNSTALVCCDVPDPISDSYRLYLALTHCCKPVVTGTFHKGGFRVMKDLLAAVRDGEEELRDKPAAVFDVCPSPPLKWSDLTCRSLMDCAAAGIPYELVSMPLSGATAPVTLAGSLVQHTAENLSGVVIGQLTSPGCPVIYGGAPAVMDMKSGTTPMGAIETMMIDTAFARIGKRLGLPVHAYMGLSDSGSVDYQGGVETGQGAVLAALAGINMVSGAGILDFVNCQSLEKLVLDNEVCGTALRLAKGIERREDEMASVLRDEKALRGELLAHPHTMKWFREEMFFPSSLIERSAGKGEKDAYGRARDKVSELLAGPVEPSIDSSTAEALKNIMNCEIEILKKNDPSLIFEIPEQQ